MEVFYLKVFLVGSNSDYIRPVVESNKTRTPDKSRYKDKKARKNVVDNRPGQKKSRNRPNPVSETNPKYPMMQQTPRTRIEPTNVHRANHFVQADDDGTGSVESFGEFHSPKATVPNRRYLLYLLVFTK